MYFFKGFKKCLWQNVIQNYDTWKANRACCTYLWNTMLSICHSWVYLSTNTSHEEYKDHRVRPGRVISLRRKLYKYFQVDTYCRSLKKSVNQATIVTKNWVLFYYLSRTYLMIIKLRTSKLQLKLKIDNFFGKKHIRVACGYSLKLFHFRNQNLN